VVDQLDHRRLERVFGQQPVRGLGDLVGADAGGRGGHTLGAKVAAAGEQRGPAAAVAGPEQVVHEVGLNRPGFPGGRFA
jgi:hypothetical protein